MKVKKIVFVMILVVLLVIIGGLVYIKFNKKVEIGQEKEITPLEEVTEEQERQTMISLYYTNIEGNSLAPEARRVDVKELIENPYKTLVEFLIQKPKNEKLGSSIPEGTRVNNAVLENGVVKIDLSKEFIENQKGDIQKANLSIYSIVNTLTELNEVNSVKILIDGEEGKSFNNIDLKLDKEFVRQN